MRPAAFARHYAEMVAAMLLGMVVLGAPAGMALGAAGVDLHADAPALMVLGMAATMTVPMVGWMAVRGHGRQAGVDMTLAMALPALAVVALLGVGLVEDLGMLMLIEHVAMFLAMAAAMLLRPAHHVAVAA